MQLRKEADAVEPEKLAKRKHQISSLYHAAKLKVTCWSCSNAPVDDSTMASCHCACKRHPKP